MSDESDDKTYLGANATFLARTTAEYWKELRHQGLDIDTATAITQAWVTSMSIGAAQANIMKGLTDKKD
jgi:hypothetical protein